MKRRITLPLILVALMATASCTSSCGPKPVTTVQPTPFTSAVRATDDIAGSIKILISAETNLEKQGIITPQEGLRIINGAGAVNKANVQFTNDLSTAIANGDKSALRPSLNALKKAVTEMNNDGVLGLKSDKAKQTFALTMGAINLSLGIIEGFVGQ